jgi:uncharacterized protein YecE (DUF72 family)
MHEGRAKPWPRYGRSALSAWLDRIEKGLPELRTWVYFNNDPGGAAVIDAAAMAAEARRRGIDVTHTP